MSILESFTAPFDKIFTAIGKAFDDNLTSDEERMTLTNELALIRSTTQTELANLAAQHEKELSNRHQNDMQSDDTWSKRIRPGSLAFLLAVTSILAVTDGNIAWTSTVIETDGTTTLIEHMFIIKEIYIELFQVLLVTAFSFYFGGRTLEKFMKIKHGSK